MFTFCHRSLLNTSKSLIKGHLPKRFFAAGYGKQDDRFFEEDPSLSSGQTTVNIIQEDQQDMLFFDSFFEHGFKFNNGMRVMGPCVVFPRSLLNWNVADANDINEKSLSLFTILEPRLDIVVIGVGSKEMKEKFNAFPIIRYLRSKRISAEVLPTEQALATFNFLNSEQRYVAGAFIPADYVEELGDADVYRTDKAHTQLAEGFNTEQFDSFGFEKPIDYGVQELKGMDRPLMDGFVELYEKQFKKEKHKESDENSKDNDDDKLIKK